MKKFIALTLSVLMLLCCVACGDRTQDIDQPGTNDPLINTEDPGQDNKEPSTAVKEPSEVSDPAGEEVDPVESTGPATMTEEGKDAEDTKEPEKTEDKTPAKEPERKQEQTAGQQQGQIQTGPKDGDIKEENGQKYNYNKYFGWVEYHYSEDPDAGRTIWDGPSELSGNKVGSM